MDFWILQKISVQKKSRKHLDLDGAIKPPDLPNYHLLDQENQISVVLDHMVPAPAGGTDPTDSPRASPTQSTTEVQSEVDSTQLESEDLDELPEINLDSDTGPCMCPEEPPSPKLPLSEDLSYLGQIFSTY